MRCTGIHADKTTIHIKVKIKELMSLSHQCAGGDEKQRNWWGISTGRYWAKLAYDEPLLQKDLPTASCSMSMSQV